jgi:hypothetical protein
MGRSADAIATAQTNTVRRDQNAIIVMIKIETIRRASFTSSVNRDFSIPFKSFYTR